MPTKPGKSLPCIMSTEFVLSAPLPAQVLLDEGLLTREELEAAIATRIGSSRVSFLGGREIWVQGVLDLGVDPRWGSGPHSGSLRCPCAALLCDASFAVSGMLGVAPSTRMAVAGPASLLGCSALCRKHNVLPANMSCLKYMCQSPWQTPCKCMVRSWCCRCFLALRVTRLPGDINPCARVADADL